MHHLTISEKGKLINERWREGEREDDRRFHRTPSLTFRLELNKLNACHVNKAVFGMKKKEINQYSSSQI